MATVFERLQKIIVEQLGVDKEAVTLPSSFIDDLNADPSDLAELVPFIEKEFSSPRQKLEISDDEIDEISTVQDVIDLLKDHAIEDD
jgi:acyl carrier protein